MTARSIAIHEAGHAVIGRRLRMICGAASIVEDEDSAGHSLTGDPNAIQYQWELREIWRDPASVMRGRIMTFMAGAEAEVAILGRCRGGDGDDREQIKRMLGEIVVRPGASIREARSRRITQEARLRRMTRMLVRRHRSDIERIAAALEARQTLSGEDIDAMLPPGFMARPVTLEIVFAEGEGPVAAIHGAAGPRR